MSWLHTWAGLLPGWLLYFMFLTGAVGYFDSEIDRWMQPELAPAAQTAPRQALQAAERYLRAEAPGAERWFIGLPVDRNSPYPRAYWQEGAGSGQAWLDPASGAPLRARATGGGQWLYQMHWRLHYLPAALSDWTVLAATMFMLVAIVTGVIVHKRIFADFFTFRPGKGQRSWLDAHNAMGVMALPFCVMITYSGLVFYDDMAMPLAIAAHYGPGEAGRERYFEERAGESAARAAPSGRSAPLVPLETLLVRAEARWGGAQVQSLDIRHPGEAGARVVVNRVAAGPLAGAEALVFDGAQGDLIAARPAASSVPQALRQVLLGLHEGLFAPPVLRALYFLSGLAGAAMIATGLVLWVAKRRPRKKGPGFAVVERLNVAAVAGSPIGIAAYFWANRLIPAEFPQRAAWEANALFIAWAAMMLHALLRPAARAWIEQWRIAAAAFALLPLLNALTTGRHLGVSLPQGDWAMAGFDLAMPVFGLVFACIAWRLERAARAAPRC